jgi:hypothetical protein
MTAPPRFAAGPTTLAHILFDGADMVDSTGNTHWSAVGAPPATPVGMWTPTQQYSGPFSGSARWVGDPATKAFLDLHTAGDFTICARYKPGDHPASGPNKIIIANGKPEAPGTGGWSLMQMHSSSCFHYHDDTAQGEWMTYSAWGTGIPVASLEWSWQCGGRDGAVIRGMRESYLGTQVPVGGQPMGPIAPFQPSVDPPTIGAYADGTCSLFDGGVYEVIITSEPATEDHMRRLVASASGGVRPANEAPVLVTGADAGTHAGAPSTVVFEPGGYMLANQPVAFGPVTRNDSTVTGVCYGMEAAAPDWTAVPAGLSPLEWHDPATGLFSQMRWNNPASSHCVNVGISSSLSYACGAPPTLAAGSRHTFMNCFDPADGRMRIYADGSLTPYVVSAPVALSLFPRLDRAGTSLGIHTISSGLWIYRVFACSTADPALCH